MLRVGLAIWLLSVVNFSFFVLVVPTRVSAVFLLSYEGRFSLIKR